MIEKKGDVFEAIDKTDEPVVFMHGCNMQGDMGSGVAKQVRDKWLDNYLYYERMCDESDIELGDVIFYQPEKNVLIANALTQRYYGKEGQYASLDAIRESVQTIEKKNLVDCKFFTVRVGCGLGGLDWNNVKPIFEKSILDWQIFYID